MFPSPSPGPIKGVAMTANGAIREELQAGHFASCLTWTNTIQHRAMAHCFAGVSSTTGLKALWRTKVSQLGNAGGSVARGAAVTPSV